jgi:hypothetical protein
MEHLIPWTIRAVFYNLSPLGLEGGPGASLDMS